MNDLESTWKIAGIYINRDKLVKEESGTKNSGKFQVYKPRMEEKCLQRLRNK